MKLLAHITGVDGIRQEQTLKQHSYQTAEYAAESIGTAKIYNIVFLAGLLHDCGKGKRELVEYLEDIFAGKEVKRGSINHTFAGVIWLWEHFHKTTSSQWERLTCEIICYAIGSHHGMFDCVDLDGENGFMHRLQKDRDEICYEEAVSNFLSQVAPENVLFEYFYNAEEEVKAFFQLAKETYASNGEKVFFQISMLIRLVLSAVIYGDRRDTGEFMKQRCAVKEQKFSWRERKNYFENKIAQLDSDSVLNQVRREISCQCLKFAEREPGIYRLNVPTGAGKTLCSLRYSLAHAEVEKYHKKRVIFIIPLLSVLDQNAKVIREYLPDQDEVLEHHSNVIHEKESEEELDWYEFLTTNWRSPVIVSTLVRLLDILFSHKASDIGRLQALCDSVIVIDEVQSLPKKVTEMFNMAINFLQQYCNATIILSSATQPCFEELKWPLHLAPDPDMVLLSREQLQIFKRAEIINRTDPYGMDWEDCTGFCMDLMKEHASLLIVCNTKTEARTMFERLQEQSESQGWSICHLSTAMCQKHRLDILQELKEKLSMLQKRDENKEKIPKLICVSTQLIEAGVDLSFQGVVRILAGVDNLAQTAGRCNRSNEYGRMGKVYLINLKNENLSMLPEIAKAQNSTRKVLEEMQLSEESLIGEQATRMFYQYLFKATKDEIRYPIDDFGMKIYLADLLANRNGAAENGKNGDSILHQPFKTAGKKFHVFEQKTVDVLVPYKEGKKLIERLQKMQGFFHNMEELEQLMQQAKQYTISIFEWEKERLDHAGLLIKLLDDRVLALSDKAYNSSYGLMNIKEQEVEIFIL